MNDTKAYSIREVKNDLIVKIEQAVGMAKKSSEWRRSFMMYQERQRTAELRGEEQGVEKNKIETAKRMLSEKLAIDLIARITGLSIDDIKRLEKQLSN